MIIIGDVHGRFDLLTKLLDKLPHTDNLCFTGDLIDRGYQSREVIEFVMDNNHLCVIGNHEYMLKTKDYKTWVMNGGNSTLDSFNEKIPDDVLDWIDGLPLYIQKDGFLISHSYAFDGIETPYHDIMWGREFSIKPTNMDNLINVFGHTPFKEPFLVHKKHWCIDTGAYRTNILTGFDTETNKFYFTSKE